LEKLLLVSLSGVVEYRQHIKSIERGNNFFVVESARYNLDDKVNHLIKLSSTYFKMVHECLYVWGTFYFPGSNFQLILKKLQKNIKFPKYPE
jgi:hypothetical protein